MYTENPFFGSPLTSRNSHNPGCLDSVQDIKRHADGHDLYSTYAQSSSGGQLSDYIYHLNNLGESPRNFRYPQVTHDVFMGDDLSYAFPEGV